MRSENQLTYILTTDVSSNFCAEILVKLSDRLISVTCFLLLYSSPKSMNNEFGMSFNK